MPRVLMTRDGGSMVREQDRLWDLQTWMPGVADFGQHPSVARLESACMALAQLHQAWSDPASTVATCPAILRRRDAWQTWLQLLGSGWRPVFVPLDPLASSAEELWRLLTMHMDDLNHLVTPWLSASVAVQPCICDLWHDHVLFAGDNVSGFIDFGSAKVDNVAVDLARLLGSLVGADDAKWQVGLAAYERVRPLSEVERALARDLDRAGTILAAAQWLRWLYQEKRIYPNRDMVRERLQALAIAIMK
jgi:Ser/Thr protein kinase RdoA (MazF antagonist)